MISRGEVWKNPEEVVVSTQAIEEDPIAQEEETQYWAAEEGAGGGDTSRLFYKE